MYLCLSQNLEGELALMVLCKLSPMWRHHETPRMPHTHWTLPRLHPIWVFIEDPILYPYRLLFPDGFPIGLLTLCLAFGFFPGFLPCCLLADKTPAHSQVSFHVELLTGSVVTLTCKQILPSLTQGIHSSALNSYLLEARIWKSN